MKKYIKFLIIALSVIAAVTLTCYIFFKNLNKVKETEVSLIEFSQGETKEKFNNNLTNTIAVINSDSSDTRFENVINSMEVLDGAMNSLSSYYINTNGVVKSKEVANALDLVKGSISLANSMISEYNIKAFIRNEDGEIVGDNTYFNRHLGANDLYKCVSGYIINYAKLVKAVNNDLTGINKSVDIKFSVIELYADVAINTFSDIETKAGNRLEIKDANAIQLFNNSITWNGIQLQTRNIISDSNTNFINYYAISNKAELAKNFYTIYLNISTVVEPTNEQYVVKCFKEVFGL